MQDYTAVTKAKIFPALLTLQIQYYFRFSTSIFAEIISKTASATAYLVKAVSCSFHKKLYEKTMYEFSLVYVML